MDYTLIAGEVETQDFASSAVHKYMGSNVKSPGLEKGAYYVIKFWSMKSLKPGSDNPFWIGQFIGAGEDPTSLFAEIPRAKMMTPSQRYFFKRVDGEIVGAANFDGALVINDDTEQRITFYALHTEPQQGALPLAAPTLRPDKARPVAPASAPRVRESNAVAPARQPTARIVKTKVVRESNDGEITEEMRALFRASGPPEYKDLLVAQFESEYDAKKFVETAVGGYYLLDGFAHLACCPEDQNNATAYFAKAKEKGSRSVYRQKVIVR